MPLQNIILGLTMTSPPCLTLCRPVSHGGHKTIKDVGQQKWNRTIIEMNGYVLVRGCQRSLVASMGRVWMISVEDFGTPRGTNQFWD